jgi:hypothetical protein
MLATQKPMYDLARCFGAGIGVEKDELKAADWFARAADAGYMSSTGDLVRCIRDGVAANNDNAAADWFCRASAVEIAQVYLDLFESVGVENEEMAKVWADIANHSGDEDEADEAETEAETDE